MKCPTGGGEMIQKNRIRLFAAGIGLIFLSTLAFGWRWLWVPGIMLALAGAYLVIWSVAGRGRWCRNCKNFSV